MLKTPVSIIETQIANLNINNYSSRTFTPKEILTLGYGLKFSPTPKHNFSQLRIELENLFRKIRISEYFKKISLSNSTPLELLKFKLKNNKWEVPLHERNPAMEKIFKEVQGFLKYRKNIESRIKIKRNFNNDEYQILQNILKDNSIVVTSSDKNLGLSIVDRSWYNNEIQRQLSDSSTYVKKEPNLPEIRNLLREVFKERTGQSKIILEKYLFSKAANPKAPMFYVIPKIHKSPLLGRPIVPSHSWITSPASEILDFILRSAIHACPFVLNDSRDLVIELDKLKITQNFLLVTADFTSLYTNINLDDLRRSIVAFLNIDARNDFVLDSSNPLSQPVVIAARLMDIVLKNNYFKDPENSWYHQIKGIAMGTSAAPSLANIYLHKLESKVIARSKVKPLFYKRYIDDLMMLWPATEEAELNNFLNLFTEIAPSITFSSVVVDSTSINFLDLVIFKGERFISKNILDIKVHQKELNKYLYIPFNSFHSHSLKKGFIKAELIRYIRNSSSFENYVAIRNLFFERLRARGYPATTLVEWFTQVTFADRESFLQPKESSDNRKQLVCVTSYNPSPLELNFRGLLDILEVRLRQHGFLHEFEQHIVLAYKKADNLHDIIRKTYKNNIVSQS